MWPNSPESEELVIFNKEILNGKLHFLCKILMPWEAKRKYVWAKIQRADKKIYEPK